MKVAVVIPARNAAGLMIDCMAAVLRQTRPAEEVLVVVGPSEDGTLELTKKLAAPVVRVLENPAGDRGSAINTALEASDAEIIAMVDAQARLAPDYLETALRALAETDAAVVGGPMRPRGTTAIGQAMAALLQSPFGVGNSQFHFAGRPRSVESVYLGVYRASAFGRVGRYNPALLRTEDDDMNQRIRDEGMVIWLDPAIGSTYLCRDSLPAIWRQYFGYGYWKVALATLRPGAIRWRHLVPAAFVIAIVIAALVSLVTWWPALLLLVSAYVLAAAATVMPPPGTPLAARILFPVVAFTMHVAYGLGTLAGLLGWSSLRRRARAGAQGVRA